ncbi:MAG: hypothetical protein OEZ35_00380 [Candidatus Bathyarchaeota archaeon]|nr:hypothetical protein [Candidatus Bathyarchaeota archaeon]
MQVLILGLAWGWFYDHCSDINNLGDSEHACILDTVHYISVEWDIEDCLRYNRHTITGTLASLREILILRRYGSRVG